MIKLTKENLFTEPDPNDINLKNIEKKVLTLKISIPNVDEFETGDIVLFSDISYIPSKLIEYFTDSKYSHCGLILKDPIYINPSFKGLYVFESTGPGKIHDSEDNKCKMGVQIRKFEDVYNDYNGAVFWRKLHTTRNEEFYKIITNIHKEVHNKPYDTNPLHWFESLLNVKLSNVHMTNRFFCSALVTYVYSKLDLVDVNIPWDMIRPKDLGTENILTNRIKFINCTIDNEIGIKKYESYVHYIYNTY